MVSSSLPPASESVPALHAASPTTRRNSDDLPAPLGPSTTSASPASMVKLSPEKTWRPPRKQARSDPERRIQRPLQPPAGAPAVGGGRLPPRRRPAGPLQ